MGGRRLTFGDSLKLSLTPTRKGEAMLVLFGKLGDEEKIAEAGELRIPLPSLRSLPEFRARVITDSLRVWVMLPSEEYREVPRDNKLCWLVGRLSSLFSEGGAGSGTRTTSWSTAPAWSGWGKGQEPEVPAQAGEPAPGWEEGRSEGAPAGQGTLRNT